MTACCIYVLLLIPYLKRQVGNSQKTELWCEFSVRNLRPREKKKVFLRVERKEGVWDVNEGRRRQKKQICHWRRRSQQRKKKSCIFLCFLRRKSAHKVPQTDTSFSNYNVFISTTSLKRIKAHPILFLSYWLLFICSSLSSFIAGGKKAALVSDRN